MEINVIEENKNKLVFSLKGEDHTLCNAIKDELWNDDSVKVATYRIDHPLIAVPVMTVETDGKKSPKDALKAAMKRVTKTFDKVSENLAKQLK